MLWAVHRQLWSKRDQFNDMTPSPSDRPMRRVMQKACVAGWPAGT
jgi:hypothetical protein